MKITVESAVKAPMQRVWDAWNDIKQWNAASTYTRIVPGKLIEFRIADGREVSIAFRDDAGRVLARYVERKAGAKNP